MNRFAALLDRLAYEPRRNAKIALVAAYLRTTPDPDRGYALAAITGGLAFSHAKPAMIRALITARVDPELFALSYDYVGDLSETVALLWPARGRDAGPGRTRDLDEKRPPTLTHPAAHSRSRGEESGEATTFDNIPPTLADVVTTLRTTGKTALPAVLADLLDRLDETGRWALLKLVTGALRIGVSARLAKTAVAALAEPALDPDSIEEVWPDLLPPYTELFAWVEGRGEKPERGQVGFTTPMLAHALDEAELATLDPADFLAEWKWDGIRVQAVATRDAARDLRRLYSRSGEEISGAFPDLAEAMEFDATIDGELLVVIDGAVQPFAALQQRLNRKAVSAKMLTQFPAHIRAYDLLRDGSEDLRARLFVERRARLEAFIARHAPPRLDLSPLVAFADWADLARQRAAPQAADAAAIEGLMLKRRDAPYVPGRPKGLWFKWKRDPHTADCVLMYAQRGHGKRSSFYSDFTFGVWTAEGTLVPVGKAYFGFTDDELKLLDRFVRDNTVGRFGPVREVVREPGRGLVLEIAFEGLQRSSRHKSGLAMRFPRIARIRWDKPPAEADTLVTLERLL